MSTSPVSKAAEPLAQPSTQHTPGPWTLRGKRLDVGTDAYCVASDWGGSNWKNDAPLIAAAPDLLAALCDLLDQIAASGHGPQFVTDDAREVIAKAQGQS